MEKIRRKFPQKNLILFEIRQSFENYLREFFRDDESVRVYGGNALDMLPEIFRKSQGTGVSVEKIFINFPDP